MYIVPLACQTTMLLFVFLIACISINDSLREPSLYMTKQIGTMSAHKLSFSVNNSLRETLAFTQLKTIVLLFKHQLKT